MKMNKRSFAKNEKAAAHPLEFIIAFGVLVIAFCLIFSAVSNIFTSYKKDDFVLRAKAMAISERLIKDAGMTEYEFPGERNFVDWELLPNLAGLTCLGLASHMVLEDTGKNSSYVADYANITNYTILNNSNLLTTIDNLTIVEYSYMIMGLADPIRVKKIIYDRIEYGTLDSDKIDALNKVKYADAKAALGLERGYDFNIVINDVNDIELLKYGKSYGDAEVIGSFARNVRIYLAYDPAYNGAEYTEAQLTVYVF